MNAYSPTPANSLRVWLIRLFACAFMGGTALAMAEEPANPVPSQGTAKAVPPEPPGAARRPPPPLMPAAPRPPGSAELPAIQKIGPGVFTLGDIQINKNSRSVSFPSVVNMKQGMLEYLLVRAGGKTHESLFRTHIEPTQLQLAMLLLGAEGTDQPLARQGDPATPKGNPVEVSASYFRDGRMLQISPEIWIARKTDAGMTESKPLRWMFTGSRIYNDKFLAQVEGSIIAIYHDPVALFDNASPGGESNGVWFVNEAKVPPLGTPITLTITLRN